jgi:hypothetical protein
VLGPEAVRLEHDLADTDDLDEKTRLLDEFLLARLDAGGTYPAFARELAALVATDGITSTPATATERRHRARLFERYLGIPPRTVGRILRFQFTLRSLMREPDGSLAALASAAGYYDQAHFIREFRLMTGGVPRGYRGYYPPDGPADFAPNAAALVMKRLAGAPSAAADHAYGAPQSLQTPGCSSAVSLRRLSRRDSSFAISPPVIRPPAASILSMTTPARDARDCAMRRNTGQKERATGSRPPFPLSTWGRV